MNARLKWARVAVALFFFAALVLAFTDFRHVLPRGTIPALTSTQFVPSAVRLASGVGLALGAVAILVTTALIGRLYCSAICPLGILQDVIFRVTSWFRRKGFFLRYAPPIPWLRPLFFWSAMISIPLGGAGFFIAWLDPYSHFGRIVSVLVRPVILSTNNLLAAWGEKQHLTGLYHVNVAPVSLTAVALVGAFLLLIVVMSAFRGRLYCNTVCPVGALLGFVSRFALFRLAIKSDACAKCAECLKVCKAQAIDLKSGTVDTSRCVDCFNCLAACDQGAMQLQPAWTLRKTKPSPPDAGTENFDAGRRRFLLTAAGGTLVAGACVVPAVASVKDRDNKGIGGEREKRDGEGSRKYKGVITPPIAGSTESFLARCTACQLCVSACTTGVLQPSLFEYGPFDLLKPHMDYERAFCNYNCNRCTNICPTGAIPPLPLPEKRVTRIGMAHFKKEHCIVVMDHTDCGACSEHCPTKAVHMVPFEGGLFLPEMEKSLCIGCGACEYACPADPKAIRVHGAPRNKVAQRPSEDPKPSAPAPTKDGFPF